MNNNWMWVEIFCGSLLVALIAGIISFIVTVRESVYELDYIRQLEIEGTEHDKENNR